jgi:hypothetical protein
MGFLGIETTSNGQFSIPSVDKEGRIGKAFVKFGQSCIQSSLRSGKAPPPSSLSV